MSRLDANRWEDAAIGDAVNVAARLETAIKGLGVPALISAATARRLDDLAKLKALGEITPKGKAEPVEVFTLAASSKAAP